MPTFEFGIVGDIASLERNGLRIAVIGFAFGSDMYRLQDIDAARTLIAETHRDHDIVIVSVHAGAEGTAATHLTKAREIFLGEDRGNIYAFAHAAVDAGADLVLGHGPHVLRAMELYRNHLIAYSLGNFCAWRSFSLVGPLAVGGILQVTLAADGGLLHAHLVPVTLEAEGIPTPDLSGRAVKEIRELSLTDLGAALLDDDGNYDAARTVPVAQRQTSGAANSPVVIAAP